MSVSAAGNASSSRWQDVQGTRSRPFAAGADASASGSAASAFAPPPEPPPAASAAATSSATSSAPTDVGSMLAGGFDSLLLALQSIGDGVAGTANQALTASGSASGSVATGASGTSSDEGTPGSGSFGTAGSGGLMQQLMTAMQAYASQLGAGAPAALGVSA